MAKPRNLRLVDVDTGEITETDCPGCAERDLTYAELERKYRGALTQIGNLRADRAKKAREHQAWPIIATLFNRWKLECNHPKSPFSPDRFWQAHPRLDEYGEDFLRLAIAGAAYQPFRGEPRKNGTVPRFDDWELIFRSPEKTEDFARRAPWLMIQESSWEIVDGNQWRLKLRDEP